MSNKIRTILRMTPNDYEMMLFGTWARWCESVTTTDREFQKVLSNPSINKWYLMEFDARETYFLQKAIQHPNAPLQWYQELYNDLTFELFSLRPMPLIKEALKFEDKSYLTRQGHPTEPRTFNQN